MSNLVSAVCQSLTKEENGRTWTDKNNNNCEVANNYEDNGDDDVVDDDEGVGDDDVGGDDNVVGDDDVVGEDEGDGVEGVKPWIITPLV